MASKYVQDSAAAKSLSAYVIISPKGEHVATVTAHYSNAGVCLVNVHDDKAGFQSAKAGGYGYDKFAAALRGLTIDGHALTDHCDRDGAPKKPKGARLYPRGFKVKKGYTLANWSSVSKATGARFYAEHWREQARLALGLPESGINDSQWESLMEKAKELEQEWRFSDDCESGYSDCYREQGLDYLKALGYRVICAL